MNPDLETYVKSLEESNEELSKRLTDAENYIAWKDSRNKRLKFLYGLHGYTNEPNNILIERLPRSKFSKYLDVFKKAGNDTLINYIEIEYEIVVKRVVLLLYGFHGKEKYDIPNILDYRKVLVDICKKDIES